MGFLGYNVMLIIERITNDKAYIADNESGVMITADISEVVAAAGDVVVLSQNRYIRGLKEHLHVNEKMALKLIGKARMENIIRVEGKEVTKA